MIIYKVWKQYNTNNNTNHLDLYSSSTVTYTSLVKTVLFYYSYFSEFELFTKTNNNNNYMVLKSLLKQNESETQLKIEIFTCT